MECHNELRVRAEKVLDQLKSREHKRPLFVEFSGTPKSGKSTCIEIVTHFFRRLGFTPNPPKDGLGDSP